MDSLITTNSFAKGLNSDLSKTKYDQSNFLDALNIRIITENGLSSLAIQNIKGNEQVFKLPYVRETYKIEPFGLTGNVNIQFTAGVVYTYTINDIETKTLAEITEELNTYVLTIGALAYLKFYYNSNYIVLYNMRPESATVPQLSVVRFNGSVVPARTRRIPNNFILGWGYYQNNIVIISTNKNYLMTDPETTGTEAAIWLVPIDDVTYQPIGTVDPGNVLTPLSFLKYVGMLNVSRAYQIINEMICRYENPKTATIVWSDNYNDLRTINILDEQVQATPEELIQYIPVNKIDKPYVSNIINGGFLTGGKYVFFYRLKSFQGALSTFSPMSEPVDLALNSINSVLGYQGAAPGVSTGKSVEITVNNIDRNYDIIQFGYTVFQTPNVAESFIYEEQVIPEKGVVTSVLNGTESTVELPITTEELNNSNRPPDVFKTITSVRNLMFAANAKSRAFDIDFDARVYRFSGIGADNNTDAPDRYAWAYEKADTYLSPSTDIDGITPVYPTSETLDLINPYNKENPTNNPFVNNNWATKGQFKYQKDGTTIGGSGPNVSYSFVTTDLESASLSNNMPYVNIPQAQSDTITLDTGIDYPIKGSFNTLKSPFISSLLSGYARGEVYRFALVFYDLFGYPSFVKWVGDIKFPDTTESDYKLSELSGDNIVLKHLGIRFDVDTTTAEFQAIKNKISGWSFVRVDRTVTNRTKLGMGLLNQGFITNSGTIRYVNAYKQDIGDAIGPYSTTNDVYMFENPSFKFNIDNQFKPEDYLRLIGFDNLNIYANASPFLNRVNKFHADISFASSITRKEIQYKWSVLQSTSKNFIPADPTNGLTHDYINMTNRDGGDSNVADPDFQSFGSKTELLTMVDTITAFASDIRWFASYERYLDEQYGGDTYESRTNDEYIFCNHFQRYNYNSVTGVVSNNVYGGDVYISFWGNQKDEQNIPDRTGWDTISPEVGMAEFFVVEAHNINPELIAGPTASKRISNDNVYDADLSYNSVYNQQQNNIRYYPKPLNFVEITEEPGTIYATEVKRDGEKVNSWRFIKVNNALSVNGNYGPINKLVNFKDKLIYYQTDAVGIAAVNERIQINNGDTTAVTLGTGDVLSRFDYVSTETGCFHQFGVVNTGSSLYHYDTKLNKLFQGLDAENSVSITDVKGLSGFFRDTFVGNIKNEDILLLDRRVGVVGVFDSQYNTVLFTFHDTQEKGDFGKTLAYNELLQCFESFHSFVPSMYLNTRRFLFSLDYDSTGTTLNNSCYVHHKGNYGGYYGIKYASYIKLLTNAENEFEKYWDNVEFRTEVYNSLNEDVPLSTINQVKFSTDYQTSDLITLIPQSNIRKTIRTWRMNIPLDNTNPSIRLKPRLVDRQLYTELYFNNDDNYNFILHDVLFKYRPSQLTPTGK